MLLFVPIVGNNNPKSTNIMVYCTLYIFYSYLLLLFYCSRKFSIFCCYLLWMHYATSITLILFLRFKSPQHSLNGPIVAALLRLQSTVSERASVTINQKSSVYILILYRYVRRKTYPYDDCLGFKRGRPFGIGFGLSQNNLLNFIYCSNDFVTHE